MEDVYQEQANWGGGAQPGTAPDRIPDTGYASGRNTAFREIGSGTALVGCRPGLTTVNTTTLAGSTTPQLDFSRIYTYDTGSAFTNYLAVVNRNGNLYYKNPDNTFTSEVTIPSGWGYGSGTKCFTAGDFPIDGTVINNRLFLIKQSATTESRSFYGTTAVPWGLSPIGVVSAAETTGGVNGMPTGWYDIVVTSYHSTTGGESSSSASYAAEITTTNRRLQVTITPNGYESALYTHWRVYIRQRNTAAKYYLATSLGTGGNIPIATTSVYVDLSQATLTGLSTPAPSSVENNPPPATAKYMCTYGRRLLVADGHNVYWSRQDQPDNFPPTNYEPIETGEGDLITGIYPYSDEVAIIFTTTAIWGIFGNNPQTWTIKPIDHTIGCLSHLSVVEFNGNLGWWSDAYGPVYYDGSTITRLGERELGRSSYIEELNLGRIAYSWAGHDPKYSRVLWAVPGLGSSRNNRIFAFNYQVGKFESEYWDPMPAASLAMGYHSDNTIKLFLGNDKGQLFYFNESAKNDGVPSGTVSGTFTGATSVSTLTGTGFYTTGSGLTGRWVLIVDKDYRPVTKIEISSNTGTALTLATAASLTPGLPYTFYIGSPDLRITTRAYDMGRTFHRKRFDRLYFHVKAATGGADAIYLTTQVNFSASGSALGDSLSLGGTKWDAATSLWDTSLWVGEQNIKKRLALFVPAQALQVTLYQSQPNQDVILSSMGVLAGVQSERNYA